MIHDTYSEPVSDPHLVACLDCDLLQRIPDLEPGAIARCPRCDRELWRRRDDVSHRKLPLLLAAALLYLIAISSPMLGISAVGRESSTTVIGGAERLWDDNREGVAVLVLFTAVVAPALQIAFLLAMELAVQGRKPRRWVGSLLRHTPFTRTWSMIEVMMLGVLVALIKISELARVIPGTAMYALGALIFLLAAIQSSFDPRAIWDRVEWAESAVRGRSTPLREQVTP